MKPTFFCLLFLLLVGCDDPKRLAEEAATARRNATAPARAKLSEALSAMKVCTRGSTYAEFRKQRLAIETCYEVNKQFLVEVATDFEELSEVMEACDTLFPSAVKCADMHVRPKYQADWKAMVKINPALSAKTNLTSEQMEKDIDFFYDIAVRRALAKIGYRTEQLIQKLQ